MNVSALGIAFLSPLLATLFPGSGFCEMPLTVLQFLWINLIIDTLAAIAFGLEPPRPESMRMPPRRPDEPFIQPAMQVSIAVMGGYFIVLFLVLQATDFLGLVERGSMMASSVFFTSYVFSQILNMLNTRALMSGHPPFAGLLKSRPFLAVLSFIVVVQVLMSQYGGKVLHTEALPLSTWIVIALLSLSVLVVGEVLRLARRTAARRQEQSAPTRVAA